MGWQGPFWLNTAFLGEQSLNIQGRNKEGSIIQERTGNRLNYLAPSRFSICTLDKATCLGGLFQQPFFSHTLSREFSTVLQVISRITACTDKAFYKLMGFFSTIQPNRSLFLLHRTRDSLSKTRLAMLSHEPGLYSLWPLGKVEGKKQRALQ